jgi:hypothetical protein
MVFTFAFQSNQTFGMVGEFLQVLIPLLMIATIVIFGWFWSVGMGLQSYIPTELQLKTNLFKALSLIPFVYAMLLLAFLMYTLLAGTFHPQTLGIILPLYVVAVLCYFYCIYFVAKLSKQPKCNEYQNSPI